jgi:hypothetical protein
MMTFFQSAYGEERKSGPFQGQVLKEEEIK